MYASLLLLQGLLIPIGRPRSDAGEQIRLVGSESWFALAAYVVFIAVLAAWCPAVEKTAGRKQAGQNMILAATLLGPLPLWAFFNGFLDDNLGSMTLLWLVPFGMLGAGAVLTRSWWNVARLVVIGLGIPLASLLVLATFVDFGN
jgi:hypothetical protein